MVIANVCRSQCPDPASPAVRNAAPNAAESRARDTGSPLLLRKAAQEPAKQPLADAVTEAKDPDAYSVAAE
jgi:hypothetical protein